MTTGYHKYGMLWTAQKMTFYFDDSLVWSIATPAVMQQPYYLLFNNGLGGGWPTDQTPAYNVVAVKSIRAFSL